MVEVMLIPTYLTLIYAVLAAVMVTLSGLGPAKERRRLGAASKIKMIWRSNHG